MHQKWNPAVVDGVDGGARETIEKNFESNWHVFVVDYYQNVKILLLDAVKHEVSKNYKILGTLWRKL